MGERVLFLAACKAGLCLFLLWGPPRLLACPVACDGRAEGTAHGDPGPLGSAQSRGFRSWLCRAGLGWSPASLRLACKRAISAQNTSWGKCWDGVWNRACALHVSDLVMPLAPALGGGP